MDSFLAAGAESQGQGHSGEDAGRNTDLGNMLSPPLHIGIPKNKSTSNLVHIIPDNSEKARIRMSFDAGAAAAQFDDISR